MNITPQNVFVTGATGYMGSRLAGILADRGHKVRALTREASAQKLPSGVQAVIGDALTDGYTSQIAPSETLVHLVGVSHPSPAKAEQFRSIDLKSVYAAVSAAKTSGVKHFVYVSVAHPSPMMKAYIAVRQECEQIIGESGLNATFIRPWYVLGPGHRWPYALLPMYWLAERFPATRESALRLGLVTLQQMLNALVNAAENPTSGQRILTVPDIRKAPPVQSTKV